MRKSVAGKVERQMSIRNWAYLVSLLGLFIFFVLIFGLGVIVPYMGTPQRNVAEEQSLSQSTQPYFMVGGIGSLISWAILAVLILTRRRGHVVRGNPRKSK